MTEYGQRVTDGSYTISRWMVGVPRGKIEYKEGKKGCREDEGGEEEESTGMRRWERRSWSRHQGKHLGGLEYVRQPL
jgi:hypothetical protein